MNKATLITLVLMFLFGGMATLAAQQYSVYIINKEVKKNRDVLIELQGRTHVTERSVEKNTEKIEVIEDRRWNKKQHDDWAKELQRLNPGLEIPKE